MPEINEEKYNTKEVKALLLSKNKNDMSQDQLSLTLLISIDKHLEKIEEILKCQKQI